MTPALRRWAALLLTVVATAPLAAHSQERGAVALDQSVRGLSVTARVLMIAAHPDDEDTNLITWLVRGRQVETAYLSLTRGDGGQNLIGNELGEALGAVRTEELLAARRLDGGRQYFTRAYDFGFSKSAEETFKHWDHDSLLGDIVTVIRAFRPHVVVSVWSGTPADGHGHHTASGILSREAYDAAGDTSRFPASQYGQAWEPLKFYRSARFNGATGTLSMNVGEYDAVLGRGYGEIAGESRAQHRSQGQGRAQLQRGTAMDFVAREASRVNEGTRPATERSLFDGVDTSFARLIRSVAPPQRGPLEAIASLADSARRAMDPERPWILVRWLARAAELSQTMREATPRCVASSRSFNSRAAAGRTDCSSAAMDLDAALDILRARTATAVLTASAIVVEASAPKELLAFGDSMPVTVTVYNRGREPVTLVDVELTGTLHRPLAPTSIAPDSALRSAQSVIGFVDTRPWWFGRRSHDMFPLRMSPADGVARISYGPDGDLRPGVAVPEDARRVTDVVATVRLAGSTIRTSVGPIIYRSSDPVLGEQNRPAGGVPAVSMSFDGGLEWLPAGKPMDRLIRLTLRSYATTARTMAFQVVAPPGIRVDSVPASLTLEAGDERELFLRVRGQLKAGRYEFGVIAATPMGKYAEGLTSVEYPHIRPLRLYRSSALYLQAVDIIVPAALSVAYVQGVGDDVAKSLRQLGIPVAVVQPAELPLFDLSRFTTVVVGPRAYEAHRELVAYNSRLIDFAKKGGTVVVQYGQQEMARPGLLPYPIALARPAQRVTEEDAPVTVLDARSRVLTSPNAMGGSDWADWVQERALYMPSTIDPHWATPLEMHDPGEPPNKGALLVAPVGKGTYVYTTLALFRQVPSGVPGGPRLLVNLLSAGLDPERARQGKVQP
ncbi:MAG TPA: PIG-L family deacetylase [Gemmatimonadaceae bacterium]|nr:PIG-L family deacetylase [Gemmatimonadaceae bacterium]